MHIYDNSHHQMISFIVHSSQAQFTTEGKKILEHLSIPPEGFVRRTRQSSLGAAQNHQPLCGAHWPVSASSYGLQLLARWGSSGFLFLGAPGEPKTHDFPLGETIQKISFRKLHSGKSHFRLSQHEAHRTHMWGALGLCFQDCRPLVPEDTFLLLPEHPYSSSLQLSRVTYCFA